MPALKMPSCLLLLLFCLWESFTAFSPTSIQHREGSSIKVAATRSQSSSASSIAEESQALLKALLEIYQSKQDSDFDVGAAIGRLQQAQVSFDPADCFNGPLYVVLHQQGPKQPLWEKIGLASNNRQGQKYIFKPATGDYDIVNYAEILGKGLFIQVEGTASGRKAENTSAPPTEEGSAEPSFLDGIVNLFAPKPTTSRANPNSNLLQCPCEIVATVEGGGLYVGGTKLLPLDFIKGTGVVRVLYADPTLRILESPYQNNGGWEDQGLIVVQVREDLLN